MPGHKCLLFITCPMTSMTEVHLPFPPQELLGVRCLLQVGERLYVKHAQAFDPQNNAWIWLARPLVTTGAPDVERAIQNEQAYARNIGAEWRDLRYLGDVTKKSQQQ